MTNVLRSYSYRAIASRETSTRERSGSTQTARHAERRSKGRLRSEDRSNSTTVTPSRTSAGSPSAVSNDATFRNESRKSRSGLEPAMAESDAATRAYLTIIEGCDKSCAYCVVPFTRGPERSRTSASGDST